MRLQGASYEAIAGAVGLSACRNGRAAARAGIEQVEASGKLIAADTADTAELNPSLDRDHQTARIGARLLARIAGLAG